MSPASDRSRQTVWHVSTRGELAPGTILEPRFWDKGRDHLLEVMRDALRSGELVLKAVLLADDVYAVRHRTTTKTDKALQEVVFEEIRQQSYPERPSRFGTCFVFEDHAGAERFLREERDGKGNVYKCEADLTVAFRADMTHVSLADPHLPVREQLERLTAQAHKYWAGKLIDSPWIELLVPAKVSVLEKYASPSTG